MFDTTLGRAVLEIVAETKDFSKGITDARKQGADFGKALANINQTIKPAALALTGVGLVAVKLASDFESSFAGVRKTVADATDEMGNLTPVGQRIQDEFRQMAKTIPVSVNELNKIGETAGQLGIKSENITKFSRVMADLGVTTNMSSEEAATALARLANITGMSQTDFDRLGSTVVVLGNNLATTESEIVAMGLRLAGVGSQIGMSEAEILGLGAALSSVGIEAEAGGTAFSRVMIRMQDAVASGGRDLEMFSRIAGNDFKQAFEQNAADAVNLFVAGLAKMHLEGQNLTPVLSDLQLGEIRVSDALRRTGNAYQQLANATKLARDGWRENTALTKEAEQRYQTFASQVVMLGNRLADLGVTFGTDLLRVIKPVLAVISDLADLFAEMPAPVRYTVIALGSIVIAASGVLGVLGSLAGWVTSLLPLLGVSLPAASTAAAGGVGSVTFAVGALRSAFSALLFNPVVLGLAGVGAAAWVLKKDFEASTAEIRRNIQALDDHKTITELWNNKTSLSAEQLQKLQQAMERTNNAVYVGSKGLGDLSKLNQGFSVSLHNVSAGLNHVGEVSNQLRTDLSGLDDAAQKAAEAFQKQVDVLTGRALASEVAELARQVEAAGRQGGVTTHQLGQLTKKLEEFKEQGASLPPVLATLVAHIDMIAASAKATEVVVKDWALFDQILKDEGPASQAIRNLQRDIRNMALSVPQTLPGVTQSLEQFHESLKPRNDALTLPLQYLPGLRTEIDLMTGKVITSKKSVINLERAWASLGQTIVSAVTGGGDVGKAMGASLLGGLGQDLGEKLTKNIGGSLGKSIGGVIGPLGALAGGAIGNLVGGIFGPSAGKKELEEFNAKIGEMRQGLLTTYGSLQAIGQLDKALGTDVAAGWAHQGKKGAEAFAKSAEELQRRLAAVKDEMAAISKDGGLASAELMRFRDAMVGTDTDVQAFVLGQVSAAAGHVKAFVDQSAILTQQGASAMSSIVLAAWDGTAKGLSDMMPTIQQFQTRLEQAGFSGSEAFNGLTRMARMAADEVTGPMIGAINSGTSALVAMANSGYLTQDIFAGLTTEVMAQRDAMLAAGATAGDVNALMQQDLQRIWQLTQDGTYAVDEKTAALLKEAEAAGLVGDKFRTSEDRMVRAIERIAELLESTFGTGLAKAAERGAKAAADAIYSIPTDLKFNIHGGSGLNFDASTPVYEMADGWYGRVTGPTLFLAGEKPGGEDVAFSGIGRSFDGDLGGNAGADELRGLRSDLHALVASLPVMVESAARHGAQTAGRRR